jgi:hypothetical protein
VVVFRWIAITAEEEFERRLAVGRVAINLVVDTLLSALVEEQIAPQGGSDYIAKAIVGIYVSVRFLWSLRCWLLCKFRNSGLVHTTTVWKRTVVEFIVEVAQSQKLEFVRSRLGTCKVDYLHHWS